MFNVSVDISSNDDGLRVAERMMQDLFNTEALVGIPEEEAARESGQGITNAALMYIHSNGSPLAGIPARPIIEPAIDNSKERIGAILSDAAKAAMDGSADAMMAQFEKAGLAGQNAAQAWFTNPANGWEELKPETVKRKIRKGSTSPKTLIDTGEFKKSVTYVVRKKS